MHKGTLFSLYMKFHVVAPSDTIINFIECFWSSLQGRFGLVFRFEDKKHVVKHVIFFGRLKNECYFYTQN